MADPLWINPGHGTTVGTAAITAADDTATIPGHGLSDGTPIMVDTVTGGAVGVLRDGPVYHVRDAGTDTFKIAASPGDDPLAFTADGAAAVYTAAPTYDAAELRQAHALPLWPGVHPFSARSGIRPGGGDPVTLVGTTWSTPDLVAALSPDWSSQTGVYWAAVPAATGTTAANDPGGQRIDLIVVRVYDDAESPSGLRTARVEYVQGVAGAGEPSPPQGATKLASITVPAGSGNPSLALDPDYVVAIGGILSVATLAKLPTVGTYDGMWADVRDTKSLYRCAGGTTWNQAASTVTHTTDFAGGAMASGWSFSGWEAWRWGPWIIALFSAQRSGVDISPGADGNVSDSLVAALPGGWRPPISWYGSCGDGYGQGEFSINTSGQVTIRAWNPGGVITATRTIRFPLAFPAV